jgi:hypothetical protein
MVEQHTLDRVEQMLRGGGAEVHDTDTICVCVTAFRSPIPARETGG